MASKAWKEDRAMGLGFLDHMRVVPDHRIAGMVTYPLDEILLATLTGIVCGADDWEGIEEVANGALDWLRGFLPFANGIATAQTFRKVFRLLDSQALARGFAAWAASVRTPRREVIAVDGKTLRGSKTSSDGTGALHLISAYASEAGLVLAQRAVDGKSNEITAIPELLDMLNLKGAIISIDAMGTQKEIARRIVDKSADYVLALKGNQTSLHEDAALFFADPGCALLLARAGATPTLAMAGSKSAYAAPPMRAGSPSATPTGRACVRSPRSPPGALTRRPAPKASRQGSTSPRSNPTPRPSSRPCAPIGASKTTSIGRWT